MTKRIPKDCSLIELNEDKMEINIKLKTGATFCWKAVKASELSSVFTDIAVLAGKDESARKAFKGQSRLNGTKKAVRTVNKGTKK